MSNQQSTNVGYVDWTLMTGQAMTITDYGGQPVTVDIPYQDDPIGWLPAAPPPGFGQLTEGEHERVMRILDGLHPRECESPPMRVVEAPGPRAIRLREES